MKPTGDDFEPRRDGWFEHRGTWEEVVVGTVIANKQRRSERWEIVEQAMATPVEFGHTLWMRAREQTSGEEYTVRPRNKTHPVTILTQSPSDTKTGEPTPPSDAEAIALLVEKLGATHLATRDNVTGEITCPDYASGGRHSPDGATAGMRDELEHLRFAHGVDTKPFEEMHWEDRIREVTTLHGRAHTPKYMSEINKGGFPHRHVPEDLTIFTGKRR